MYTNMKNLPTDYYYVYSHVDPTTGELMYIGHGYGPRAWIHGSRKTVLRSQDHLDWLHRMNTLHFLPTDYVIILERNLTKAVACKHEQQYIRTLNPLFNKPQGLQNMKVTKDSLEVMKGLRDEGFYYREIAEQLNLSTMTVYRALNNQTKNLGENNNVV